MNNLFRFFLLLSVSFLTSCCRILNVETRYFDHKDLASFHVGTPDPRAYQPDIGQKLFISWRLPFHMRNEIPKHVLVQVRFHNQKEMNFTFPILSAKGVYVVKDMNETYFETKGILSYKIIFYDGENPVDIWVHPLWCPSLHLNQETSA